MYPPTFAAVFAKSNPLFVTCLHFLSTPVALAHKNLLHTSSTYSNMNFIKPVHEQPSPSAKADNGTTPRAYQGHLKRDESALAAETLILSSFFDGNKVSV